MESQPKRVVVVGSSNMDLVGYAPKLPSPGETIMGSVFEQGFGGKGANQAVVIGKLGGGVAMVSKVGADGFGRDTISNYVSNCVDATYVTEAAAGVKTGVALISVDAVGENSIIVCPGANMAMTADDVEAAQGVFQHACVVICQNEVPLDVTRKALELGKAAKACTIWNVAPCPPEAKDYSEDMFQATEIIIVNEMEAAAFGGTTALLSRGVTTCLVTLGKNGCKIVTAGGEKMVQGHAIPHEKVVDTTGAGDAFTGAFAHFVSLGTSVEKAAMFANRVASITVQSKGTQKSYPSMGELPKGLLDDSDANTVA